MERLVQVEIYCKPLIDIGVFVRTRDFQLTGMIAVIAMVSCDTPESRANKAVKIFADASAEVRAFIITASFQEDRGFFGIDLFDKKYQRTMINFNLGPKGAQLSKAVISCFEEEIILNKDFLDTLEKVCAAQSDFIELANNDPNRKLDTTGEMLLSKAKAQQPQIIKEIPKIKKIIEIYEKHQSEVMKLLSQ